jgi:hypothetical protein
VDRADYERSRNMAEIRISDDELKAALREVLAEALICCATPLPG